MVLKRVNAMGRNVRVAETDALKNDYVPLVPRVPAYFVFMPFVSSQAKVHTDKFAYRHVEKYLSNRRQNGKREFTVLDVMCDVGIYDDQLARVMEKLRLGKKISEGE